MNVHTRLLDISICSTKTDCSKKPLSGPLRFDYFAAHAVRKGQEITSMFKYITKVTPITVLEE